MRSATHILLLFLFWHNLSAQSMKKDSLVRMFTNYANKHLQEKLYVRIDEGTHLAGETLWFKVHAVDVFGHQSLDISKVVYLEVLDRENKAVLQTKVELKDGYGTGSLFLPATLSTGYYWLRAYTRWMRNLGPEFYFQRPLTIINTLNSEETTKAAEQESVTVQFFPEGGTLVGGLQGKIGFRVTDQTGAGINFKGALIDESNDTVAHFAPLKFGIGSFAFRPAVGKKYRSVIAVRPGPGKLFAFPEARKEGFALGLQEAGPLNIQVDVQAIIPENVSPGWAYLIVHSHQQVTYAAEIRTPQSVTISKKDLRDGISHFTLFDQNLQPVAERLYFKRPPDEGRIVVATDQADYGTRKKVVVELSAEGLDADSANVSVSVSCVFPSFGQAEPDIRTYLWLTSDLAGGIESPEYYLGAGEEVAAAADNLMLTHGWRRFKWQEMQSTRKSTPQYAPEYHGHLVQAKVLSREDKPVPGVLTYLSSPGKGIRIYPSISNAAGDVSYETLHLEGKRKIILQIDPTRDSTAHFSFLSPYSTEFAIRPLPKLKIPRTAEPDLKIRSVGMQVNYMFGKEPAITSSPGDTTAFFGQASERYKLDAYTRFPVMEEVMREYVKGVLVRKRKDRFHFLVLDNVRLGLFNDTPLILLDGVPVFDVDKIVAYDPLKVARLEVLTKKYFLGPVIFNGIVSYRSYSGDMPEFKLDPAALVIDYDGLQQQREFYSPSYGKAAPSRIPDQRHLLFWAPSVWCKLGEKKKLEFYTSDLKGKFLVTVEGMSARGKSAAGTGYLEVHVQNP